MTIPEHHYATRVHPAFMWAVWYLLVGAMFDDMHPLVAIAAIHLALAYVHHHIERRLLT